MAYDDMRPRNERVPQRGEGSSSPDKHSGKRESEPKHSSFGEKLIAGIPARVMRPRLIFSVCLFAILGFGLLMVYSASSVEALKEYGSSTYFLYRQAVVMLIGLSALAAIVLVLPTWMFDSDVVWFAWGIVVLLLLGVMLVGHGSRGAVRWINIAGFQFQPSEFAKPVLIVLVAKLFDDCYVKGAIDSSQLIVRLIVAVAVPCGLIFVQPDFGTVLIIGVTLFAIALFVGVEWRTIFILIGLMVAVVGVAALAQPYRVTRFLVSQDPWSDEYGSGYQATLAIMAFASGGLFGRGVGNSTMKYNYLPEAHNDYILAIIGEELGFVGTLVLFLVFALMCYAALKIAERASSKLWALMAGGSGVILIVQFLINALGILNVLPMTGKPLPFISYGGSSVISCLMIAGLVLRASVESGRRSMYDVRRDTFAVYDESTAGEVRVRRRIARSGFSVVDGRGGEAVGSDSDRAADIPQGVVRSAKGVPFGSGRPRTQARSRTVRPASYERVDLNADPSARLRVDDARPRVRYDSRAADPSRKGRYER